MSKEIRIDTQGDTTTIRLGEDGTVESAVFVGGRPVLYSFENLTEDPITVSKKGLGRKVNLGPFELLETTYSKPAKKLLRRVRDFQP